MATVLSRTNRLLTTGQEASLARDVLDAMTGAAAGFSVERDDRAQPVPAEIGDLIRRVLEAVAAGVDITITATPPELTTSAAAAMLGVSRPTLMKLIAEGAIASHKVGSHTRLKSQDVLIMKAARRARERQAFSELRELEDDE